MTPHVHILIAGAGLTGLSTAYHLEKKGQHDYLLLEKQAVCGGLCASTQKNGFTYDYGGHLLHLHTPYGKRLIKNLLGKNLQRLSRRAFIDVSGTRVPYPFQANLFALTKEQQRSCIKGLSSVGKYKNTRSFERWCKHHFGTGIYELFFKPYNTKLWGISPSALTSEWCPSFVPLLSAQEIQKSCQKPSRKDYGYNASFYYPKRNGCRALVDALLQPLENVRTHAALTAVNLSQKTARINGQTVSYDFLVNTLPLPQFCELVQDKQQLGKYAARLSASPVTVYHLGINRALKNPFSWIYFPEKEVPFFRVGLQSSFSPHNAPKGTSLFYIEIPGLHTPSAALKKQIWNCLVQKGIIKNTDRSVYSDWHQIPYAYARYDTQRTRTVNRLLRLLRQQDCYCAGRYGLWEYSFMEKSLLDGRQLANVLN